MFLGGGCRTLQDRASRCDSGVRIYILQILSTIKIIFELQLLIHVSK